MRSLTDILMEDLDPKLGSQGGPCAVIQRIRKQAPKPLQQALIDPVEDGEDLSNQEASKVYQLDVEPLDSGANSYFKRLLISNHAQYRMDLRGVTVDNLKAAFAQFTKEFLKYKSTKSPIYDTWMSFAEKGDTITWTEPKTKLILAFVIKNRDIAVLSAYYRDAPKPKAPGDGGCDK